LTYEKECACGIAGGWQQGESVFDDVRQLVYRWISSSGTERRIAISAMKEREGIE